MAMAAIALPVQAAPASRDTVDMQVLATGAAVAPGVATSTLLRNDNGVGMTIHTVGLPGGTADTVWWVIFNNSSACSHGTGGLRCGVADLFVPAVMASVQFAAGHIVGPDGVGDYGGYLREGDISGCASPALPCNGLASADSRRPPGRPDSRRADPRVDRRTDPLVQRRLPAEYMQERAGLAARGRLRGRINGGLPLARVPPSSNQED